MQNVLFLCKPSCDKGRSSFCYIRTHIKKTSILLMSTTFEAISLNKFRLRQHSLIAGKGINLVGRNFKMFGEQNADLNLRYVLDYCIVKRVLVRLKRRF